MNDVVLDEKEDLKFATKFKTGKKWTSSRQKQYTRGCPDNE
jgi:hypothetical protein